MPLPLCPAPILPLAAMAMLLTATAALAEDTEQAVVQKRSKVGIQYTMKLDDGTVVDTSEGGESFVYEHGSDTILPALEAALAGLSVGSETELTLTPEQGYGPIHERLYHTVPIDDVPEGAREKGAQLVTREAEGNERPLEVHEVTEDGVVLDLNHPLAGETLHFELEVISIE